MFLRLLNFQDSRLPVFKPGHTTPDFKPCRLTPLPIIAIEASCQMGVDLGLGLRNPCILIFFSFRLELIPRRRGVSHSDPLPPHVSSPGVIWFQVEKSLYAGGKRLWSYSDT